jgi:sugar/nucleoside kinase (ribokinase family)
VLATDGYPFLRPTLQESEKRLEEVTTGEPLCMRLFKPTKGLQGGNLSFDDRAYLRLDIRSWRHWDGNSVNFDYDIAVLGDITLDWYCRSPCASSFAQIAETNGAELWAQIDEIPGGSGLLFARFSRDAGYKTYLIGSIGDDPAGKFIHEWLRERELEAGVRISSTFNTAKVFITHDSQGSRLLVSNGINANGDFSASDVEQYFNVISNCRLLYVSGYCFRQPHSPRVYATRRAIDIARNTNSLVALDVVPHEFHKFYPGIDAFLALTEGVDIIISEVATIRRVLGLGYSNEDITRSIVEDTIMRLAEHYSHLILRFGPNSMNYQVVWLAKGSRLIWQETGFMNARDRRGFGDKLAVEAIHSFLVS